MLEINNRTSADLNLERMTAVVEKFLLHYDRLGYQVDIAIVSNEEIRELNKTYRKIDKETDILSFENTVDDDFSFEDNNGKYLGELVISYEKIIEQAKIYSDSVEDEFIFILVHGLLHLIGYEDRSEKGRIEMETEGKAFIKTFN